MNSTFARKVTVLHKSGYRQDYTHVVKFDVVNPLPRRNEYEPVLIIQGEIGDVDQTRCNVTDKLPVRNLHMTIIDWYVPEE